jgi:hypothetical protein
VKDGPVPGKARPIHLYSLVDPSPGRTRGQRRGLLRIDMRTKQGRLLRRIREGVLNHLTQGAEPTIIQCSLAERCAWLELQLQMYDAKQIAGQFTSYDAKVYYAAVNSLKRLYKEIGFIKAPPPFASLIKPAGRRRKDTSANAA